MQYLCNDECNTCAIMKSNSESRSLSLRAASHLSNSSATPCSSCEMSRLSDGFPPSFILNNHHHHHHPPTGCISKAVNKFTKNALTYCMSVHNWPRKYAVNMGIEAAPRWGKIFWEHFRIFLFPSREISLINTVISMLLSNYL